MKTSTKRLSSVSNDTLSIEHKPVPQLEIREPRDIESNDAKRFVEFMAKGVEAWIMAGKLLVQMVDRNPNAYKLIMAESPQISIDLLIAFERIGRRKAYPYLLLDKSPGAERLLKFSYDNQERYFREPVDVVLSANGKQPVIVRKNIMAFTHFECDQVLLPDRVRTVDEQITLLKSRTNGHRSMNQLPALDKLPPSIPSSDNFTSLGKFRIVIKFGKPQIVQVPKTADALHVVTLSETFGDIASVVELRMPKRD